MRKNKKGISPLIATVLLIGFTIVLAALVMRWGGTLFRETTQTTGCESQGRIACISQVEISVGNIGECIDITRCDKIGLLIVNNLAATQSLEAFNVQREWDDGAIESGKVTFFAAAGPVVAGESREILEGGLGTQDVFYDNTKVGTFKAIHVIPIFTQTTTDGGSCRIVCSEQKETIPKGDPRIIA